MPRSIASSSPILLIIKRLPRLCSQLRSIYSVGTGSVGIEAQVSGYTAFA